MAMFLKMRGDVVNNSSQSSGNYQPGQNQYSIENVIKTNYMLNKDKATNSPDELSPLKKARLGQMSDLDRLIAEQEAHKFKKQMTGKNNQALNNISIGLTQNKILNDALYGGEKQPGKINIFNFGDEKIPEKTLRENEEILKTHESELKAQESQLKLKFEEMNALKAQNAKELEDLKKLNHQNELKNQENELKVKYGDMDYLRAERQKELENLKRLNEDKENEIKKLKMEKEDYDAANALLFLSPEEDEIATLKKVSNLHIRKYKKIMEEEIANMEKQQEDELKDLESMRKHSNGKHLSEIRMQITERVKKLNKRSKASDKFEKNVVGMMKNIMDSRYEEENKEWNNLKISRVEDKYSKNMLDFIVQKEVKRRIEEYSIGEKDYMENIELNKMLDKDVTHKRELLELFNKEMGKKKMDLEQREVGLIQKEQDRIELEIQREKEFIENRRVREKEFRKKQRAIVAQHRKEVQDMEEMIMLARDQEMKELEAKIEGEKNRKIYDFKER